MRLAFAALLTLLVVAVGCGGSGNDDPPAQGTPPSTPPVTGQSGGEVPATGPPLGFPVFATKNTTRVAGGDAVADAAGVALATYPARTPESRPTAVVLAEVRAWQTGIAASVLAAKPIRAPILFADGDTIPDATKAALDALQPTGSKEAGGAQVIRVGTKAPVEGYKTTDIPAAASPAALAAAVDRLQTSAVGSASNAVVVVSSEHPQYAMPVAGWAANSGTPVLWVTPQGVPPETEAAIKTHRGAAIYVVGPEAAVPEPVFDALAKLGTVKRVTGTDPVSTAITFARYQDGAFGWAVVDPGHGIVVANARRPQDAAAAAPLSAHGKYGPLLLLGEDAGTLPPALQDYLLDIQPGYDEATPAVRGVYNHGWIIGDESALAAAVQARIDTLLEIQPVESGAE
ncbi:cell wall-binding repeat-containing protein [Solirubrobacter sp. CPCC 204708]|uniref:Cell wall-binding repeat-containing protein n=1 Tax=Solirubrobacter deserti TaxID=2282478 RepID=A0ABT4RTI5_9ACTN|nr:cell wall-binding repeat-containing protein [Solirubrobacter deserti]MBE2318429.1 cell wall-binding repeat-containing protein [Solirubrobacter deserti]MDA0141797.1 cell wall-binding repeat-containing protein [Solirubrobacter deserti]